MYGSDVDMLVAILKSHGFMLDNLTKIQGMSCYDSGIVKLVKSIQMSKGLNPNGICDKDLLSMLM